MKNKICVQAILKGNSCMKRIFALVVLLALGSLSLAQQKMAISVMDLNVTSGISPQEGVMLTDCLLNEFISNGVFKVVDRSNRDMILKEQSFQMSGACDQGACLVEAGQLLGVHKMFGGTIGKMGTVFAVQLRMIDVKSGEADMAFTRQYSGDISSLLGAMKEAATEFCKWKPKPKAQAIAETKAETGNIKVVSTPTGATIFLDGSEAGITSGLLTKLDVGEHQIVVVKDGFSSFSKAVTVNKNVTTTVSAALTKEYGTLNITSEPAGANAFIDGISKGLVGSNGLTVRGLGIGAHKIKVTKAGYQAYEVEMTVESGDGNSLNAQLTPKPGSIVITSTPGGASVTVDGTNRGNTPCSVTGLEPGSYSVKVEKTGYEDGEISVSVGAGQSVAKSIVLKITSVSAAKRQDEEAAQKQAAEEAKKQAAEEAKKLFKWSGNQGKEGIPPTDPEPTSIGKAEYPIAAKNASITGRVFVKVLVGPDGKVKSAEVLRGIGGGCDEAALEAAKKSTFKPGTVNGRPADRTFTIPYSFR